MKKSKINKSENILNRDLFLPYALPYFVYVGITSLIQNKIPVEIAHGLKIIIVPLLLYWAWKWYVPIVGPKKPVNSILYGIVFGLAGLVIWCVLMAPFIDTKGEAWVDFDFFLRAFSATLIVPVFEEIFMRGYILRVALQWDINRNAMDKIPAFNETLDNDSINDVTPGAWSVMAIAISSIAFAAGHMPVEWLAAIAYSILISVLWIIRKDLLSCIVAHAITNLTLAIYVYYTGNWGFW